MSGTLGEDRFIKGGKPGPGRPKGARNKTTLAIEALLDGEGEALTRKAIELAQAGDMTAMRLCLERLCPPRRDRHVSFTLPPIAGMADIISAHLALLSAVASGEITPGEAGEVSKLLDGYAKAMELSDLSERIAQLEQRMRQ